MVLGRRLILDGEMIAFDPSLGKVLPFGNLKTFANLTNFGPTEPRPMCGSPRRALSVSTLCPC